MDITRFVLGIIFFLIGGIVSFGPLEAIKILGEIMPYPRGWGIHYFFTGKDPSETRKERLSKMKEVKPGLRIFGFFIFLIGILLITAEISAFSLGRPSY